MAAATLTNVVIPATGSIVVNFSDGTQYEYQDRDAITNEAANLVTADLARKLLVARWAALNPALNDPEQINGTVCEVNLNSVLNPVAFGEA